jgi:hypothetical protein
MHMRISTLCAAMALSFFAVSPARSEGPAFSAPPPPKAGSAASRAVAAQGLNSTGSDVMLYTPIAPCRVFGGIAQSAGQTLNFQITGSANLGGQGGPANGCGIPGHAKAVSMNLSATSSAAGKIIAFAKGATRPNTVSLNYQPGKTETAGTVVAMDDAGKASIYTSAASRTFGDVTGYYSRQITGMIAPDGSIYNGNSSIVSSLRNSAGSFKVTVDRDVTYCSAHATGYSGYVYASAYTFDGNKVQVYIWYLSGSAQVAYDSYFYISVNC